MAGFYLISEEESPPVFIRAAIAAMSGEGDRSSVRRGTTVRTVS